MADKSEVAKILLLMTRLPNSPLDDNPAHVEQAVEMYHLVLKDLDTAHLMAAAAQYLSTGTFFPTPGNLRQTALDLEISARGIPTAAEAWGSVQEAKHYREAVYCLIGARLRQDAIDAEVSKNGNLYTELMWKSREHEKSCVGCLPSRTEYVYAHPVIEQVVNRLGGYDNLLTDNEAADRARFISAYETIVAKETKETSRLPEVTKFIDTRRAELAAGQIKRLAGDLRPALKG